MTVNAQAEAEVRLETAPALAGRYSPRVLEPSPPSVDAPPWFADDPVARGESDSDRQVVSPVTGADVRWKELADGDAELTRWCAERWLVAPAALSAVPAELVSTRLGLHRLAERVIAPVRQAANGKIGLRFTRQGFGTPYFGPNQQLRVQGAELVVTENGRERQATISTLAAAARLIGPGWLPADLSVDEDPLAVDPAAAHFLGDWFGFAALALEELRATAPASAEASRVQLWPEHFDLSLELGAEADGARAAYGFSPGDELHPEPYAYVAPWEAPPAGELWTAEAFAGAELGFGALRAADDPLMTALEFCRIRLDALARP